MNTPMPPDPLDPDLTLALAGAQREAPLSAADDALLARVRTRVLRQVAHESVLPHHVAVAADQGQWKAFLPGIQRKVLHLEGGVMSYLLRFEPGAVLPAHRHPVDEECVVVQGRLRIGPLTLEAGSYHRVPQGVLDADSTSDEGALIFLRGAVPREEQLV